MSDFWALIGSFVLGFVLGSLGLRQNQRDRLESERQKNADLRVKIAQLESGGVLYRNTPTN